MNNEEIFQVPFEDGTVMDKFRKIFIKCVKITQKYLQDSNRRINLVV